MSTPSCQFRDACRLQALRNSPTSEELVKPIVVVDLFSIKPGTLWAACSSFVLVAVIATDKRDHKRQLTTAAQVTSRSGMIAFHSAQL